MNIRNIVIALVSYVLVAVLAAVLSLLLMSLSAAAGGSYAGWPAFDVELLRAAILIVLISAFVPFVVAMLIMNLLRQTGWLAHMLAGGLVTVIALLVLWFGEAPTAAALLQSWPFVLAGVCAGLAYKALTNWLTRRFVA